MGTRACNESRVASKPNNWLCTTNTHFLRVCGVTSLVVFQNTITEFSRFPPFSQVAYLNFGRHNRAQYLIILKTVKTS